MIKIKYLSANLAMRATERQIEKQERAGRIYDKDYDVT